MVVTTSIAPKKSKKSADKKKAKKGETIVRFSKSGNVDEEMTLEPLVDETASAEDEVMIDVDPESAPQPSSAPSFPALPTSVVQSTSVKSETRRIPIPPHRMTPIKKDWVNIFSPLTEILGLQVRMNVHRRCVELRVCPLISFHDSLLFPNQTSKHTKEIGVLQKGADFVKAYALGFDVNVRDLWDRDTAHSIFIKDAIALLRLDDLYLDSFEIKDVKTLHGDHLSRAIGGSSSLRNFLRVTRSSGRIAGHDGKTKFTIENATRTRIVLADTWVGFLR